MRNIIGSKKYDLDALVFADVGMDMQSVVLSNSRLAPIQVRLWKKILSSLRVNNSSIVDDAIGRMVGGKL